MEVKSILLSRFEYLYFKFFIPLFFRFEPRGFRPICTAVFMAAEVLISLLYIKYLGDSLFAQYLFFAVNCLILVLLTFTILKVVGLVDDRISDLRKLDKEYDPGPRRIYSVVSFASHGRKHVVLSWSIAIICCLYVAEANVIVSFTDFSTKQLECFGGGVYSGYLYTIVTLPPRLDVCTEPVVDKVVKALRYIVNAVVVGALLTEITNIAYRKPEASAK